MSRRSAHRPTVNYASDIGLSCKVQSDSRGKNENKKRNIILTLAPSHDSLGGEVYHLPVGRSRHVVRELESFMMHALILSTFGTISADNLLRKSMPLDAVKRGCENTTLTANMGTQQD